ncbi:hypothetical protein RE9431_41890 [Prescottella equi]|nr:hypothetical protein RE9431_41890 [Prescottella equi]BCN70644.1 hypothetical protein RE943_41170 [Prescottella equi]BCN75574.1 hypothetical protein RE0327_41730 [Prescottella equi]BDC74354.1 hypothetical protein KAREA_42690 [Prescottella equi]BDE61092.1 hypothetical protein REA19_41080 [Prescottella equi]
MPSDFTTSRASAVPVTPTVSSCASFCRSVSDFRKPGPHTAEPNGPGAAACEVVDVDDAADSDVDGWDVAVVSVPFPDEHPAARPAHRTRANACRIRMVPTVVDIDPSGFRAGHPG